MLWTLILWIHAGPLSDHDCMELVRVPNFYTQAECQRAGEQARERTKPTAKVAKFQCVPTAK